MPNGRADARRVRVARSADRSCLGSDPVRAPRQDLCGEVGTAAVALTRGFSGYSWAASPMNEYRLHYFPESGNSYKLALMLTLCGQDFELIWTDFAGGQTRTADWRQSINPMGEIPVLEDSGQRLTQTGPILLRLAERHGQFGGKDDAERFEI